MALDSLIKSFDDLQDVASDNSSQIKYNSFQNYSKNVSPENILGNSNVSPKKEGGEPIGEQCDRLEIGSPRFNYFSLQLISFGNGAMENPENFVYDQSTPLIQNNTIPLKPPPSYSHKMFASNDSETKDLANDFRKFTKSFENKASCSSKQFDETLKSIEDGSSGNDLLKVDKNKSFEVESTTKKTSNRNQSAAVTSVIRSGATRGSRRVLNVVPHSASIQNTSPQPSQSKSRRPPSSASLLNSIDVNENGIGRGFREMPLRRVLSSSELRNLTFQTWCERRGKEYLEERRKEQLKRLQEEEEARMMRAEKSKQNEKIFAMWLAKKQQQALEAKKKRLKVEEEAKREAEESKKQLQTEAEKAFEAWKRKKEKETKRRHSSFHVDREKAAEELRAKLEKSIAAHLAFEAWQKQANQRLQEARERESARIREEESRKAEMEAMRKKLARTSYTQWELRKAFQNQSTRNVSSSKPLVAKPPWRPTSARINLPRP